MRNHTVTTFEAFGARLGIYAPAPIASRMHIRLPPGARATSGEEVDMAYWVRDARTTGGEDAYLLRRDEHPPTTFHSLDALVAEIESDLHFRVAKHARDCLFIHAGVVEVSGKLVLLPGRTYAGKSSLVLELVRLGAVYWSDEYAVVDEHGQIFPYRRPLSQRQPHGAPTRLHEPSELGPSPETVPLKIGLTVWTWYDPNSDWSPEPMTRGEALIALLDNTVLARERTALALSSFTRALEDSTALRSPRPDAAHVASAIMDTLRPHPQKGERGR